jgi:cytochrome c oxidase assembly factor 7
MGGSSSRFESTSDSSSGKIDMTPNMPKVSRDKQEMDMSVPEGMNLVDERYEEKMAAFEVDCNDGHGAGKACHHVGEFYSVVKDEHDRAKAIYEVNCFREKDPYYPSCFNLAKLYLSGRGGVGQNDEHASELFKRACDHDHLQACYHQGVLQYLLNSGNTANGSNVKDEKIQMKAIKVLEKACVEGESDSCYFAGSHYINKETSTKQRNPPKAVKLLEVACTHNHAPSCYNLATLFKLGDVGVPADKAKYEEFKNKTQKLIGERGALQGTKTG